MRSITSLSLTSGLLLIVLLAAIAFGLEPQAEQEIRDVLSTFMQQVRERTPVEFRKVSNLAKRYGTALVPYLEEYLADPCDRVRREIYEYLVIVGLDSNDVVARQAIVYKLLNALTSGDETKVYPAKTLLQFTSVDFTEQAKELVRKELRRVLLFTNRYQRRDFILLAGVADLKSELPLLKQFIDEREEGLKLKRAREVKEIQKVCAGRLRFLRAQRMGLERQWWQGTRVWAALRARARMGVKEDIQRCIELVDAHPNEDRKGSELLRELAYVRQPEVVDYIYDYLKSDKVEKWKGRDVIGRSYAERAAMALVEMLPGFPARKGLAGADAGTIKRCRKWMAEQKQKLEQEEKQWDIIR